MIGKDYLTRQAVTLLKLAKATTDPQVHANLATKAAELQARRSEAPQDIQGNPSARPKGN
jgi:hypothetical protein